jgi:hypothetical protein
MELNNKRKVRRFLHRVLKMEQKQNKKFGNGSNEFICFTLKSIRKTK